MPAPQGMPQGQGAPSGDPSQDQSGGQAEQFIQMIQQGYAGLMKMAQQSQGSLPPEDMDLIQKGAQASDDMIQSLTGPADAAGPAAKKAPPGGPMAANQSAGSRPDGPQC